MSGTFRSHSEATRRALAEEMKRTVEGICAAFGAKGTLEVDWGTPPVVNDKEMSQFVEQVVTEKLGSELLVHVDPVMGGEDFSHYLLKKPGAFVFVGMNGEKSAYPHHHPRFDIDEDVMPTAINLFIQLVKQFA